MRSQYQTALPSRECDPPRIIGNAPLMDDSAIRFGPAGVAASALRIGIAPLPSGHWRGPWPKPNTVEERDISNSDIDAQRLVLSVPPGLEVPGIKVARREHDARFERLAPGLILSKDPASDPRLAELLRKAPIWTFGSFRLIKKVGRLDLESLAASVAALRETVSELGWEGQAYWLQAETGPAHSWARQMLNEPFGLRNDPGNYTFTLKVSGDAGGAYVLLGPSISVKQRFAYRKADVAASINPVLAAFLVRLLPRELDGRAIDPTCGSGTLLFERLRYSNEKSGLGLDISHDARKAFAANLQAVDLDGRRVDFRLASSVDPASWEGCSSVYESALRHSDADEAAISTSFIGPS